MTCSDLRPKGIRIASAWIAFILTAPCLGAQVAGLEIKMNTSGNLWFGEEGTFNRQAIYRMSASHASLESEQQLEIVNTGQRKFYIVDLLAPTYSEFELPVDIMAQLADPRFRLAIERVLDKYDPSITIQRSETTEVMNEYEVTRVEVRVGGPNEAVQGTFRLWVSADLEERLAAYPFRQLERSRFASSHITARWMPRAFGTLGGFPVQTDADFKVDGRRTTYRRTLVSIREAELSEKTFALPSGLERVQAIEIGKPQPLPGNGE